MVDECGFVDLGYVDSKFTWSRQIMGETTMWERLDRALANDDWISMFPATKVMHLECGTSNHKLLIILP